MTWRAAAMAATTIALYALWLGARPLHRGARAAPWRRRIYVAWARAVCRIIGLRGARRGEVPPAPCVVVCNHCGYVDIVFIAAELGAVFVSKAEVRGWPLFGSIATSMGTLYVERENPRELPQVNRTIAGALDRGERVVIFPEGTSTDGTALLPFRAPLFESAAKAQADVRCAAVRYRTPGDAPPAARVVCWGDRTPFLAHGLRLLRVKTFSAELALSPRVLRSADRKELALEARTEVERLVSTLERPSS